MTSNQFFTMASDLLDQHFPPRQFGRERSTAILFISELIPKMDDAGAFTDSELGTRDLPEFSESTTKNGGIISTRKR